MGKVKLKGLNNKEPKILRLKSFQFTCNCPADKQKPVMKTNIHFDSSIKIGVESIKNIFTGSRCFICHKFTPRKEGHPSEICYKCGSNMDKMWCRCGINKFKCSSHICDFTFVYCN